MQDWKKKLREIKTPDNLIEKWAELLEKHKMDFECKSLFELYGFLKDEKDLDVINNYLKERICHYCKNDMAYLMKKSKEGCVVWSICFGCFKKFFDERLGEGKHGGRI